MKKWIVLVFLIGGYIPLFGQPVSEGYFWNNATPSIELSQRVLTDSTADTTKVLAVSDYKTLYVSVQTFDTMTVLWYYRLSLGGESPTAYPDRWTTWALIDSTVQDSVVTKITTHDFTSTVGGVPYMQFYFKGSAEVSAFQDTLAQYSARYTLKPR